MKKAFFGLALLVVLCVGFVGCNGGGSQEEAEEVPTAWQFHTDQPKAFEGQRTCPVCGGQPIKEEFYADTDAGRVYFDKQACVEEFKGNEDQYLQKLRQGAAGQMGGEGSGGQQGGQ